jgi:hypothetical protein
LGVYVPVLEVTKLAQPPPEFCVLSRVNGVVTADTEPPTTSVEMINSDAAVVVTAAPAAFTPLDVTVACWSRGEEALVPEASYTIANHWLPDDVVALRTVRDPPVEGVYQISFRMLPQMILAEVTSVKVSPPSVTAVIVPAAVPV